MVAPVPRRPLGAWKTGGTLADGSSRTVATGQDWRTRPGPVAFDSMHEGETFAPVEDPEAWLLPGDDDSDRAPVLAASSRRGARRGGDGREVPTSSSRHRPGALRACRSPGSSPTPTCAREHADQLGRARRGDGSRSAPTPPPSSRRTSATDFGVIVLDLDRDARTLALTVPDGTRATVVLPQEPGTAAPQELGPGEHLRRW